MLKLRIHGEAQEIEKFVTLLCNKSEDFRVLSVSEPYKDRGASVYVRYYIDIAMNDQQADEQTKMLKG
jgi:hypothetical protein